MIKESNGWGIKENFIEGVNSIIYYLKNYKYKIFKVNNLEVNRVIIFSFL